MYVSTQVNVLLEGVQQLYKSKLKSAIIELYNFSLLMRSMFAFIDQEKVYCVRTKSEANMFSSLVETCIDQCKKRLRCFNMKSYYLKV